MKGAAVANGAGRVLSKAPKKSLAAHIAFGEHLTARVSSQRRCEIDHEQRE